MDTKHLLDYWNKITATLHVVRLSELYTHRSNFNLSARAQLGLKQNLFLCLCLPEDGSQYSLRFGACLRLSAMVFSSKAPWSSRINLNRWYVNCMKGIFVTKVN